ncbi:hypothetical protein Tco_1004996 [Tanacetum coccineum]|uniref:Integrase, catalytic region, zinc finger, CCHC-type, peptidase aspartic, catalytic n=1 Tax=Tanacetum coccineum TaxID=301880 RepID=A0ABQ5FEM5_9ASTR
MTLYKTRTFIFPGAHCVTGTEYVGSSSANPHGANQVVHGDHGRVRFDSTLLRPVTNIKRIKLIYVQVQGLLLKNIGDSGPFLNLRSRFGRGKRDWPAVAFFLRKIGELYLTLQPVDITEMICVIIFPVAFSYTMVTVLASCQHSTLCVRKYCVSELSSYAGSELGSELTFLAGSELRTSELDTSELKISELQMGTFRETLAEGNEGDLHLGPERPRVYSDLSPEDKERYNADIRATNILLQGLPKDIYSLINHYNDAKDIWDNVKMLLEGSELTKEDRESQLYDDFEHFRQHKGETIHDYYVRFAKHIKVMRNIKITMSRMQLNSKFVNNMLPEWDRFVTAVKLNRGLSLMDNLIENLTNTLALLTQSYKTYLPQTNNQLRTLLNPRNQATVQKGRVVVQNVQGRQNRGQGNNARGAGAAGYGGAQNRVGNANPGQARQVKCYNCNGEWVALDEEQLLFLAGRQDNAVDEDVDEQPVQDLVLNVDNVFQADDCDAFDSDVDEAPTAQTMFMANLSSINPVYDEASPSYDSDILSEVHNHDRYQDAICEHHEEHEMHDDVQPNYVVDSHDNYTSDSNMILYDRYVKDNAVPVVQSNVSSVPNDAYMMIFNDMHEPHAQSVSDTTRNTVVDNSLTAEFATYKEQVEL